MKYWTAGDIITAAGMNAVLLEEYNNHSGILDNFLAKGNSGAGAVTEQSGSGGHSFRLSSGISAAGTAYITTKKAWTLGTNVLVANFLLSGNVNGAGVDRYAWFGLDDDFSVSSSVDGCLFYQDIDNTWYAKTRVAAGTTSTAIGSPMASAYDGYIMTIIATSSKVLYLNEGVIVATHTTNIPIAAMKMGARVYGTAATVSTARTLDVCLLDTKREV